MPAARRIGRAAPRHPDASQQPTTIAAGNAIFASRVDAGEDSIQQLDAFIRQHIA